MTIRVRTNRWLDRQANRMRKHFLTLLESVKNHVTQLKMHFQPFQSTVHNVSEIFCVILYVKHAIVHTKKYVNFVTFSAMYVC